MSNPWILDGLVVLAYFIVVIGIGLYKGRGERSIEGFAVGDRNIPWWAVLASILAAEISAGTFLGTPGEGYALRNFTYASIMTVDVNIVTSERKNAVLVPALAVRHDPPLGGRPGPAFLFRAEDGRAVRTVVETGAVGADVIEVRRGVSETSTVLAAPPDGLKDGQRIHATEKPSGGTVVTSGVRP